MIDACSLETKDLITIDQALESINRAIKPIIQDERVILKYALNRILSHPVYSVINIPADNNSAMDGYAFSSNDIIPGQSFNLTLQGTSWAGKPFQDSLKKQHCIRIFTGAVIPAGADSIIMQEQVDVQANQISLPATAQAKQYIRHIGSDIKKNSVLLSAPKKLSATDIGLLASAGIYDIPVKRKQNIAFFSTGDELSSLSDSLQTGQIYDSNRYTLTGLLNDLNRNISDLGVIKDDKQLIKQTLLLAAKTHDVIITTGGASVGEADYIKEILDECGEVSFWKIAIKPGKPLAFGKINDCYFFGLPGNPVSVIATFQKIVLPALNNLSGIPMTKPLTLKAICNSPLKKQPGRQEYQRGILSQDKSGNWFVESAGKQGSNIMSSMSKANCYIVLPIDSTGVTAGETVMVEPFEISL